MMPVQLTYAEARARVLAATRALPAEPVPLAQARGRALRRPVTAPHPLPPFDNSSMDGYAVRAADLGAASLAAPRELAVVGVLPAGHLAPRGLRPGEAMRIMTGAAIPPGADAIVPFEECERIEADGHERARFTRPARAGDHVRRAGADIAAGELALPEGRELSAHDLALLAALGVARVETGPRPRAAILSTGDELISVEDALRPGMIRDSNVPQLAALLEEAGCQVVSSGSVPDDPEAVAAHMGSALDSAEIVLTIGGVSAGDFDPVKVALEIVGEIEPWRVAMRPGRPQAFGTPRGRLFFGLPGNPASVACVFEALVRPALRKLQGFTLLDRPRLEVRIARRMASAAGRTDFLRATLTRSGGTWWAAQAGEQISGHLTPQARSHALVIVPAETPALEAGDAAEALILRWPESTQR